MTSALAPVARVPSGVQHADAPSRPADARGIQRAAGEPIRFDAETEKAVLGALLLEPTMLVLVQQHLSGTDFYHPAHAAIFESMCAVAERKDPLDIVTLSAELRARSRLNAVGGMQYLGELTEATPTTANVETHAQLVAEYATIRRLGDLGTTLRALANDPGVSSEEIVARGTKALTDFALAKPTRDGATLGEEVVQFFDAIGTGGEKIIDVRPTCIEAVDRLLRGGGLRPGQLVTIAARPSMGKSALGEQIARQSAAKTGKRSLFFSLEMRRRELFLRALAAEADIDAEKLERETWEDEENDRLTAAANRLYGIPLSYYDPSELSFSDLRAAVFREQRKGEIGLVVIDYLQLMRLPPTRDDNRAKQLGELTRSLKTFAGAIECPIVILSQLNRDLEKRPNKRPQKSDLRESGSIENDSDLIFFIYRDEKYNKDTADKGIAEIILDKQRNGATGTARVRFRADRTQFLDLSEEDELALLEAREAKRMTKNTRRRGSTTTTPEESDGE